MHEVLMRTGGVCVGNPGPAGWGVILEMGDYKREYNGYLGLATPGEIELTAILKGLLFLRQPCEVTICVESPPVEQWLNHSCDIPRGAISRLCGQIDATIRLGGHQVTIQRLPDKRTADLARAAIPR